MFGFVALLVTSLLIARVLQAKQPSGPKVTLDDFTVPTADSGRPIPWVFGTVDIKGGNCIWYGDLRRNRKKKKDGTFYMWFLGVHYEYCIGPIDSITRLKYGDKIAWEGNITESSSITIDDKGGLFGGIKKGGGIGGDFDFCFGEPDQPVNDYLAAQLGTPLSAFRDSFTVVGRQPYLIANSTSIRALVPRVTSILKGWVDDDPWYPGKAAIDVPGPVVNWETASLVTGGSLSGDWTAVNALNLPTVEDGQMKVINGGNSDYLGGPVGNVAGAKNTIELSGNWTLKIRARLDPGGDVGFGSSIMQIGTSSDGADGFVLRRFFFNDGTNVFGVWHGYSVIAAVTLLSVAWGSEAHEFIVRYVNQTLQLTVDGIASNVISTATLTGSKQITVGAAYSASWERHVPVYVSSFAGPIKDMNPAHMIVKAWTDRHQGMQYPLAQIDLAQMETVADTLFDENFGLSYLWAKTSPISEFVEDICRHIGAMQTINPETGQLRIKLLRDDYNPQSLPLFTEADVVEVADWQESADSDATNTLTVKYLNREMDDAAITVTNRASVMQIGVSADQVEYKGIKTAELAARVGERDLAQLTGRLAKGRITFDRSAWDLYPGDVFRFSHGPEGITERVLRVLGIDQGSSTDKRITLDVVDDVFGPPPEAVNVTPEQGGQFPEPRPPIGEAQMQRAIEAPYWQLLGDLGGYDTGNLPSGAGYVIAACATPSPLVAEYDLWARVTPDDFAETASDELTVPGGKLNATLARQVTSTITLTDGVDLSSVEPGMLALIDDEICPVTAVNGTSFDIDRGALDTVPAAHAASSTVLFLPADPADWPRGSSLYVDADDVDAKLLPGEEGGQPTLASIVGLSVTMASRQHRPYPPGNVKVNGEYFASDIESVTELVVTWSHRDRAGQGLTVVPFADGDHGQESGVTYTVEAWGFDLDDVATRFYQQTGISGTTDTIDFNNDPPPGDAARLEVRVWSVRGGVPSWQTHTHDVATLSAPYGLHGEYFPED